MSALEPPCPLHNHLLCPTLAPGTLPADHHTSPFLNFQWPPAFNNFFLFRNFHIFRLSDIQNIKVSFLISAWMKPLGLSFTQNWKSDSGRKKIHGLREKRDSKIHRFKRFKDSQIQKFKDSQIHRFKLWDHCHSGTNRYFSAFNPRIHGLSHAWLSDTNF